MSGGSFNWYDFTDRWQQEWVPRSDADEDRTLPLGRPGAGEAAIAAAEERLGRRLPPSYRGFLAASDGWHVDQPAGIYELGGAADIDWFGDPHGLTSLYEQYLVDDPREENVLLAGMWQRALRLETDSDMSHALLDPGDSDPDGEWGSASTRPRAPRTPGWRRPACWPCADGTSRPSPSWRRRRPSDGPTAPSC